jgi:stage V sporulation protein K
MSRFKVGDIIAPNLETGVFIPYVITGRDMLKAKVVKLVIGNDDDLIIRVLDHIDSEHIGTDWPVDSRYFKHIGYVSEITTLGTRKEVKKEVKEFDLKKIKSLEELNNLNGLDNVKKEINEIMFDAKVAQMREKFKLKNTPKTLHMIFKGNPGTGKTTVARLVGEIMREAGFLKAGKDKDSVPFVEVTHSDFTSKYMGETERYVKQKFEEAKGGILFIDEAYSFVDKGENNQLRNAVALIVKLMEDMRDHVIVIAAGYDEDMEKFLDFNTGLRSRFANVLHFEDYSPEQLVGIAKGFCEERDYSMSTSFVKRLKHVVSIEIKKKHFGNARTVRNIIEKAIRAQSKRVSEVAEPTRESLMELKDEDIYYDEEYALKLIKEEGESNIKEEKAKSFFEKLMKSK